jgi:hypothetical protein
MCVTDPESITGINATYVSDTDITLTWDLPEGEYNAFEVKIHLSLQIKHSRTLLRHSQPTFYVYMLKKLN